VDGLGISIINDAISGRGDMDCQIVARLFYLLAPGDKSKLRKFAAIIPRDGVLKLIPLIESGRLVLREPLLVLLRSCIASTHEAGTDQDERKRSLLVCLDIIRHIAKTSSVPDLNFVRAKFANVDFMRVL
jgi:hypothetical protein